MLSNNRFSGIKTRTVNADNDTATKEKKVDPKEEPKPKVTTTEDVVDEPQEYDQSKEIPVESLNDFEEFLQRVKDLYKGNIITKEHAALMAIVEMKRIFINSARFDNKAYDRVQEMDKLCWNIIEPLLSFAIGYNTTTTKNPYADIYTIKPIIKKIFSDACEIAGIKYKVADGEYSVSDAVHDFFLIFG